MALSQKDVKNIEEMLKNMVGAAKNMALYPPGHPSVKKPLQTCHTLLKNILLYLPKLSLTHMEGILIVAERPFYDTNMHAKDILQRMEERKISQVDILAGLAESECARAEAQRPQRKSAFIGPNPQARSGSIPGRIDPAGH